MTNLVLRKVRGRGGVLGLKLVPAVPGGIRGGGVVKMERVSVTCPACGEELEAVARDGRVEGYCSVANQYVDFRIEPQLAPRVVPIGSHPTAEARAKLSAALKEWHKKREGKK